MAPLKTEQTLRNAAILSIPPRQAKYVWLTDACHRFTRPGHGLVRMEVRGPNDLHVAFHNQPHLDASEADSRFSDTSAPYEFNIGGFKNKRTTIRRYGQEAVQVRRETRPGAMLLGGTSFEHWWFLVDGNLVLCGKGEVGAANVVCWFMDPYPVDGLEYVGLSTWNHTIQFRNIRVSDVLNDFCDSPIVTSSRWFGWNGLAVHNFSGEPPRQFPADHRSLDFVDVPFDVHIYSLSEPQMPILYAHSVLLCASSKILFDVLETISGNSYREEAGGSLFCNQILRVSVHDNIFLLGINAPYESLRLYIRFLYATHLELGPDEVAALDIVSQILSVQSERKMIAQHADGNDSANVFHMSTNLKLDALLDHPIFSDINLVARDGSIRRAHSWVLGYWSDVFGVALGQTQDFINDSSRPRNAATRSQANVDVSPPHEVTYWSEYHSGTHFVAVAENAYCLDSLLRFFYRQELVCDSENALSVLAVADHFQVSPLKLHAVHVLLKALLEESEDIDLLLLLLNFARGSRCAYLGDFCLEFLARCYDRIWLNPLFLEMSAESLSELLLRDVLAVRGDDELFISLLVWVLGSPTPLMDRYPIFRDILFPRLRLWSLEPQDLETIRSLCLHGDFFLPSLICDALILDNILEVPSTMSNESPGKSSSTSTSSLTASISSESSSIPSFSQSFPHSLRTPLSVSSSLVDILQQTVSLRYESLEETNLRKRVGTSSVVRKHDWKTSFLSSFSSPSTLLSEIDTSTLQSGHFPQYLQIPSTIETVQSERSSPFSDSFQSVSFLYAGDGDENGVCFFLGTNGGMRRWMNPHTSNMIRIITSGGSYNRFGKAFRLVDRGYQSCWFVEGVQPWIQLEFLDSRHFICSGITFRRDSSEESLVPFLTFGSFDGMVWDLLLFVSHSLPSFGSWSPGMYRTFPVGPRLSTKSVKTAFFDWCAHSRRDDSCCDSHVFSTLIYEDFDTTEDQSIDVDGRRSYRFFRFIASSADIESALGISSPHLQRCQEQARCEFHLSQLEMYGTLFSKIPSEV